MRCTSRLLPTRSSLTRSLRRHTGTVAHQEDSTEFSSLKRQLGSRMYATIRRYEAIDKSRTDELVKKVDETLVPRLSKLKGFGGYHLVDAGDGVVTSIGFFDTAEQADESTRIAATWVRDESSRPRFRARPRSPAARSSCTSRASSSRPSSSKPFRRSEKARTRGPSSRPRTAPQSIAAVTR